MTPAPSRRQPSPRLATMDFKRIFLAILAVSAQQMLVSAEATARVVDLGYATYQTDVSIDEGVMSFLGVRYAAAPVGAFITALA
jgi:hypothetical protein